MIFIIIIIVVGMCVFFYSNMKNQARNETVAEGGLTFIFTELHLILIAQNFQLINDNITSLEYRMIETPRDYAKLMLRKNMSLETPYELQLFAINNGTVKFKTIPYSIKPNLDVSIYYYVLGQMTTELELHARRNLL